MRRIVLDLQNRLYARAVQRILVQELDENEVFISEGPDRTLEHCRRVHPHAVLMEVTGYPPWGLEQRLALREELRAAEDRCKVVLLVDEVADRALAEQVKRAKQDGRIDLFIYGSTSASFMAALMDSV